MSKNTFPIILQGQSDWELWIFVVKQIAESGDVWEYINPENTHHPLRKPEKPSCPTANTNDDGSSALTQPTQTTQEPLAQYNQDLNNYFKEIKGYRRLKDKLGQVEAHITKTIHQNLLYHIKDKDSVEPAFAANISLEIFKAEEIWNSNRTLPIPNHAQLPTILADFLRFYRTTQSRNVNIHGGAFGATLNGKESPYDKKRARNDAKPSKPCLCGDTHFWGQCPYIDTSRRPRGFVEDPEKAKKITEYEAKDKKGILNKIREKNRRFKRQKSKESDKHVESDSIEIDAGDGPSQQHEAYAVYTSAFSPQSNQQYPLLHSWTLDPATDIHICNNPAEFQWKRPATDDDTVLAGGTETPIEAWGEATIPLSTPNGTKSTTLKHVAPSLRSLPVLSLFLGSLRQMSTLTLVQTSYIDQRRHRKKKLQD
ncbi:hypothetical protein M011DRAFT_526178 [Sporormia fimetaria CBS 119925]|uniref:Uncharacterized protein n=1 Tax=Sporormia fimetaria CBS 119925 TaxID=1340428 RepID=A0A6A6VCH1_9PLEO|nr:hypothetical protein M011DRAFT_526178 [Sporormia fimetaria CBS 119925]